MEGLGRMTGFGFEAGDIAKCSVVFPQDFTRQRKIRPVVILGDAQVFDTGLVPVCPLSCTSIEVDNIEVRANGNNGLDKDCSAVTSQVMVVNASSLGETVIGRVDDAILHQIMESIGMS